MTLKISLIVLSQIDSEIHNRDMGPTIYREKTTAAMKTKSPIPMHSSIVVRLWTDLAQIVAILGQNIVFGRQV